MRASAKLIFLCGQMAAGKSTAARELAEREKAVLLVQDDLLGALFPGEIKDVSSFVKRYTRLKNALTPHICALLSKGIPVVLDFAAATASRCCTTAYRDHDGMRGSRATRRPCLATSS
jgi:predicted kinase